MKINRRDFLILTAAFAAGCAAPENNGVLSASKSRIVNAGPVNNYIKDGVYSAFRHQGFFIIRQGGKLFALSSICTHRRCTLDAEVDRSFYCPCHGSTFDSYGHVTQGPAHHNLPVLPTVVNDNDQLLVTVTTA